MGISFWQIAIVVVLVVLLFGRGKISSLMGDVAKGIKSFKKGMSDDASTNNQNDNSNSDNFHISNLPFGKGLLIFKGITLCFNSNSASSIDDLLPSYFTNILDPSDICLALVPIILTISYFVNIFFVFNICSNIYVKIWE